MYYIEKHIEVSFAHQLDLPYESRCTTLHGHNAMITIFCKSEKLNAEGMVVDFQHVKRIVKKNMDHCNLSETLPFQPTAENIAYWLCTQIPCCYKVVVQESEGNIAIYEKDEL